MRILILILAYVIVLAYAGAVVFAVRAMPPFSFSLIFTAWIPLLFGALVVLIFLTYAHLQLVSRKSSTPIGSISGSRLSKVRGPIISVDMEKGVATAVGEPREFPSPDMKQLQKLHRKNGAVRMKAVEELVDRGPRILPMMFYHCREEGEEYRQCVLEVIERVHPEGMMAALIEGLESTDLHSRWQICNVLRDMGEKASPAVPYLVDALVKQEPFVADHASSALSVIGFPSIEPLKEVVLNREFDEEVRREAAIALTDCFWSMEGGKDAWGEKYEEVQRTFRQVADDEDEPESLQQTLRECLIQLEETLVSQTEITE